MLHFLGALLFKSAHGTRSSHASSKSSSEAAPQPQLRFGRFSLGTAAPLEKFVNDVVSYLKAEAHAASLRLRRSDLPQAGLARAYARGDPFRTIASLELLGVLVSLVVLVPVEERCGDAYE